MASTDKFYAARISVPPDHMAALCRFEAIEWKIKFEGDGVKRRATKLSSLIVEIHHHAGVDAANAVEVKQRGLIDFNALQGSTLNHRNIPPINWSKLLKQ
jgi:hypothetical protein